MLRGINPQLRATTKEEFRVNQIICTPIIEVMYIKEIKMEVGHKNRIEHQVRNQNLQQVKAIQSNLKLETVVLIEALVSSSQEAVASSS